MIVMVNKKNPLKEHGDIYLQLKQKIIDGKIKAGQPIRQDDIASQFGVSKIPVREALRRLEANGLVEFIPRRGAFVVELTEDDILEMLEIRLALESRALELAIPNMTGEDFLLAREILEEYESTDDELRWSELNRQFHLGLYAPCGLLKLIGLIHDLKDRSKLFMHLKITQASGFKRPHDEHIEILNACENQDIQKAVGMLRQHIETTKKEVAAYYRKMKIKERQS